MQPVALIDHHVSQPHTPPTAAPACAVRDQLHRRYFAEAGTAAARFGIAFPRVIHHLEEREAVFDAIKPSSIRYLDDLVHAIACIDDDGRAWADLQERYDQFLIRRCTHRGGQIEAALAVGRLFVELRRHTLKPVSAELCSMWTYTGATPMRSWLADRLGRIHGGTPHATVITAADATSRSGREPTIRVRTTRINLAQPIVAAPRDNTMNRYRHPAVPGNGSFRIDSAPVPGRETG